MAKAKSGKRKHSKPKVPALATAGALITAYGIYSDIKVKGMPYAAWAIGGVDPGTGKLDTKKVVATYTPAFLGILGSAGASKLGLNRYMSAIPFIRW